MPHSSRLDPALWGRAVPSLPTSARPQPTTRPRCMWLFCGSHALLLEAEGCREWRLRPPARFHREAGRARQEREPEALPAPPPLVRLRPWASRAPPPPPGTRQGRGCGRGRRWLDLRGEAARWAPWWPPSQALVHTLGWGRLGEDARPPHHSSSSWTRSRPGGHCGSTRSPVLQEQPQFGSPVSQNQPRGWDASPTPGLSSRSGHTQTLSPALSPALSRAAVPDLSCAHALIQAAVRVSAHSEVDTDTELPPEQSLPGGS